MRLHYNKKVELTLYDIGGHSKFRQIWPNYYADVMGCIYVIDASDSERFEENKKELHQMYNHEYMNGKPLLILFNRSDSWNIPALSEKFDLSKMIEDKYGFGTKQARVCIRQANVSIADSDLQESIIA
jgi:GTP-binding protein SAR1